ncbi:hypothetical protein DFH28DRAFT_865375, partial [Melampsora americana]
RKQDIQVCPCEPLSIRMMQHGYLVGTPDKATMALSIPVVQLLHKIWKKTTLGFSSFSNGYIGFLESAS